MKEDLFINIGEVKVSNKPAVMKCLGLGSCIGLFLYDRVNKVGGGAHILLPESDHDAAVSDTMCADGAIDQLISKIEKSGGMADTLRAVVVGGSNILRHSYSDIGRQNRDKVIDLLTQKKIYICKEETGGEHTRSVRFSTTDGSYKIYESKYLTNTTWQKVS